MTAKPMHDFQLSRHQSSESWLSIELLVNDMAIARAKFAVQHSIQ